MVKISGCLCVLVCLMVSISCESNKKKLAPLNENVTEIYLDKNKKNDIQLDSVIDIVKILPLETNNNSFLSAVNKVLHYNDKFYVLDKTRNKLFIFNDKGKFKGSVGNRGHGPGEYIDIADYCIDTRTERVLVLSIEKRSLYYYNMEGEHIITKKLSFQAFSMAINKEQEIAFYLGYFDEDFVNLKITDMNTDKILYYGFGYPKGIRPMNLTNITGGLTNNKKGFLYSDATSSYIHQISDDGKVGPRYHINFGSSFIEEEKKYEFYDFFEDIQKGNLTFLTNLYEENENALVFTYNRESSNKKNVIVQRFNAYYDKYNKIVYSTESLKKTFLSEKLSSPLGITDDEKFISIINPIDYLNYIKENQNRSTNNLVLRDVLENIEENDNPIIILYDIKK